jgi:hypothetical protein
MKATESIDMIETKLGRNIEWSGGGDTKSKAKMMGVWVRVYNDKDLVHEYVLPNSLMTREVW